MTALFFLLFILIPIFFFYHEFLFSITKWKKQTVSLGRYENKKYKNMISKINMLSEQIEKRERDFAKENNYEKKKETEIGQYQEKDQD
jgi:hypothetical protein